MAGFEHKQIGPWPRGMMNVPRETLIPPDGLADAVNVDLRPDGTGTSRHEWQLALAADARDLFRHGDRTYGVLDGVVSELHTGSATGLFSPVDRVHWTNLNDKPVFCTREHVYQIDDQTVTQLTVARDEQDVDDALVDLPGGQWVDYWNGRLVVARGTSLLFSEPLRYGAHNPHIGYVQLPKRIEWVAPLESGVFVGQSDKVLFLQGRSPEDFSLRAVAGPSAPGMGLVVPGEVVNAGDGVPGQVAVFFTRSGFTLGLSDGTVRYPQGGALRNLPLFRGKLVRTGHRIFAVRGT